MDLITILIAQKLVILKGPHGRVIVRFIAHNSMHTTSQYTCEISQFNTYSTCHLLTIHHTFIIPRQRVIMPYGSYTYNTVVILIFYVHMINHLIITDI